MGMRSYDCCKRHPSHKQSKGVCPFCLRERLSQIPAAASPATTNLPDSNSASDHTSPSLSDLCHVPASRLEPLKKSRSLAFVMEEEDQGKAQKKKRKFWSRLMMGGRRELQLMHSKTTKDKPSSKWVVF